MENTEYNEIYFDACKLNDNLKNKLIQYHTNEFIRLVKEKDNDSCGIMLFKKENAEQPESNSSDETNEKSVYLTFGQLDKVMDILVEHLLTMICASNLNENEKKSALLELSDYFKEAADVLPRI